MRHVDLLSALLMSQVLAQDPCSSQEIPPEASVPLICRGSFNSSCPGAGYGRVLLVAASVSCTGLHAVHSQELRRGLALWALRVNAGTSRSIGGLSGHPLQVHLLLRDDRGDAEEVRRIYSGFARSEGVERPDILVGPFSSDLSVIAAEATAGSGLPLFLPAAPAPQIFGRGFSHIFSLLPSANDYMSDVLTHVKKQGAMSVVLASGRGDLPQAVCKTAAHEAASLGMKVLRNSKLVTEDPVQDSTSRIQEAKKLTPDVFIGCGTLSEETMFVVSAMAVGFQPKAFVLMQGAHPALIHAVEARNANYLCGLSPWLPELGDKVCKGSNCNVFADGSDFVAAYQSLFGTVPEYHSAAAAAAGVLLWEAALRYNASFLRQGLLSGLPAVDTFYGRLKFQSNGLVHNDSVRVRTVQLKPLPQTAPPFERYASTAPKVIGEGGEVLEDLPSWEQKRHLVYPCSPGDFLQDGTCRPCPLGHFRNVGSLVCLRCGIGTYAAMEGQASCSPCPSGANCSSRGTGLPQAAYGHFMMPLQEDIGPMPWNYQRCDPPSICLGGNQCLGNNDGVLCERCMHGTTNQRSLGIGGGKGACMQCPAMRDNIIAAVAIGLVFCAYTFVIFKATIASAMSVRHLQSIILKIVMNYLVFFQVALQSTGFWDEIVQELAEFMDATGIADSSHGGPIYVSFDCLLQQQGFELFSAHISTSLMVLPAVLICNTLFCVARNFFLMWRIKKSKAALAKMHSLDDKSWNWYGEQARDVQRPPLGPSLTKSQFSSASESGSNPRSDLSRTFTLVISDSIELPGPEQTEAEIKQWKEFRITIIQTSVVWAFLLYPLLVETLLKGSMCEEFDQLRLVGYPDVVCFSHEHLGVFALSISGLLVYGLGVPLLFYMLLCHRRDKLMVPSIRRKFGFLYNGFEIRCYHFECIYMMRKLLILVAASLPQETVRGTIMLCLGMLFFAQHLRLDPFDNREYQVLDRLEILNLWCLVATLMGRLLFDAGVSTGEGSSASLVRRVMQSQYFRIAIIGIVVASHLAFWLSAVRALMNDLVVRPLRLRKLLGMKLKWWQQCLLTLYRRGGLGNTLSFRARDRSLDVSNLSEKERHFLTVTLQKTLECYMSFSGEAQPGLVSIALQEAVLICMRTRRLQGDWLCRHQSINVPYLAGLWGAVRAASHRLLLRVESQLSRVLRGFVGDREENAPPTLGERAISLMKMPGMAAPEEFCYTSAEQMTSESVSGIFVEELHDALMVLWPEIMHGWPELHTLPEAAAALPAEMPVVAVWSESQGVDQLMKPGQARLARKTVHWHDALGSQRSSSSDVTLRSGQRADAAQQELEAAAQYKEAEAEVDDLWVCKMLRHEDDSSDLERAVADARSANERSLRLACLLLLERRRAKKMQQALEEALDKNAVLSSKLTQSTGASSLLPRNPRLPRKGSKHQTLSEALARDQMQKDERSQPTRPPASEPAGKETNLSPSSSVLAKNAPQKSLSALGRCFDGFDEECGQHQVLPILELQAQQDEPSQQMFPEGQAQPSTPKVQMQPNDEPSPEASTTEVSLSVALAPEPPKINSPGPWLGALRPAEDLKPVSLVAGHYGSTLLASSGVPPDIDYRQWRKLRQHHGELPQSQPVQRSPPPSSWRQRVAGNGA
eukprot:TRINITY_DN27774_c0_g2_i1.p1 TRINITY_DN27774_c0_g2~~TRINITY_DN27774_c0_g2_i1.p1  ORF type:complete len:1639 (+),score=308.26 TRINITY_DN27774_c0_g2_i1:70-4986(+)